MINDVLATIMRALVWLVWTISFVTVLPLIGLYYTRWHKPLIAAIVLVPVLMMSLELHRQWVVDKHRFAVSYILAQTEHMPIIYHDERSLPDRILGFKVPDDWQTYGEARTNLLNPENRHGYFMVKYLLGWHMDKAIQLMKWFIVIGYFYGALYAMLAAWAARWRD